MRYRDQGSLDVPDPFEAARCAAFFLGRNDAWRSLAGAQAGGGERAAAVGQWQARPGEAPGRTIRKKGDDR